MFSKNTFYKEARRKVMKQGYKFSHSQHNGDVFATLTGDNMLLRKVISMNGKVGTYKPAKATEREKQMYALT